MEIWDYYTAENLYTGPTYDLELISDFEMANPSNETSLTSTNNSPDIDREDSQRCLTGCYGTTQDFPRDEVSYLLYELSRLKEELDQQTTQWRNTWDSLDVKKVLSSYTRSVRMFSFCHILLPFISNRCIVLVVLRCLQMNDPHTLS